MQPTVKHHAMYVYEVQVNKKIQYKKKTTDGVQVPKQSPVFFHRRIKPSSYKQISSFAKKINEFVLQHLFVKEMIEVVSHFYEPFNRTVSLNFYQHFF